MSALASRRALLCGVAILPTLIVGAVASSTRSDLARACDWAITHSKWIDGETTGEGWSDEQMADELDRYQEVMERASTEQSAGPADIAAKARLLLYDLRDEYVTHSTTPDARDVLTMTVLQEVIALLG